MKVVTFRLDDIIEKEMDDFLKTTNTNRSAFIKICIIEKLAKLGAYSHERKELDQLYKYIKKTFETSSK